jgi:hydroxymethylpyrimidine/phosphomethylpyrimidine kinase
MESIEKIYTYPKVLTIAGSDSGGGAGIQADLKTIAALGAYGTSAITAITVQNTMGVTGIHQVPPAIVQGQIKAVMDDILPDAIKIGMVHDTALVETIYNTLLQYPVVPVILDPVMVATSGDRLIQNDTVEALVELLLPLSTLITPNLDEAAILADMQISSVAHMKIAAEKILTRGCNAVLIKGGHLTGAELYDVYLDQDGREIIYASSAIPTNNTHGTGCSLSAAIAAFMSRGFSLIPALTEARIYVHEAIQQGSDVKTGNGNGPLNHSFQPLPMVKHEINTHQM